MHNTNPKDSSLRRDVAMKRKHGTETRQQDRATWTSASISMDHRLCNYSQLKEVWKDSFVTWLLVTLHSYEIVIVIIPHRNEYGGTSASERVHMFSMCRYNECDVVSNAPAYQKDQMKGYLARISHVRIIKFRETRPNIVSAPC